MVGQCEISHPVPTISSIDVTSDYDLYSPMDGLGEIVSQRRNVMFDRESKDEYDPLPARINSKQILLRVGDTIHT